MLSDKSSDSKEEDQKPNWSKRSVKQIDYNIRNMQNIFYGGQNKLGRWSHEEHLKFVEGKLVFRVFGTRTHFCMFGEKGGLVLRILRFIDSTNYL
jgi:hypothetical protein